MMRSLAVSTLLFTTTIFTFGQTGSSNKKGFLNMEQAKRFLQEENWEGAASAAEKILSQNPSHPDANYMGAMGHINAKNYNRGFELISNAAAAKNKKHKDIDFWMGRAFMGIQNVDSALFYMNRYKSKGGKRPNYTFGFTPDYYLKQLENAKKYMATPVKVAFKNLGEAVNDEDDDVAPSLTAEGDLLIFTSRRNSNIGGLSDPYDGRPFQDIWLSRLDTVTGKWRDAENLTKLNTSGHEANMSISPDGNTVFIYKNVSDNSGSGDIWFAKTKGDPTDWNRPKEFEGPFNSTYFETSACLAPGGKKFFFVSERPDGKPSYGSGDIWMCERLNRREWKKPVNLGAKINSLYDEISVTVHPNGKTIFFASNGEKSMGGYDIFRSEWVNDQWTEPVNLGYPLNTMGDEIHFTISADGKKAFIAAIRPEGLGRYDIYEVDLSDYDLVAVEGSESGKGVVPSGAGLSILKGKIINGTSGTLGAEATITVFDAETGSEVIKTDSDENGLYFITLEGAKRYKVTIEAEGFKTQTDEFYLGKRNSGTPFTLSKSYYLQTQ
ncbi:MAG: carboxypeptidase-like regulatory domain-containing protein [Flavobacteriales bacterium]|nr:carboxypeptidase-like regulatory domain-containing protein [Flavobacteriales bacterium]